MSEVIGKIRVIEDMHQVSESFKKRNVVIETDTQYPQYIPVEFKQDKTDLLNGYNVGDSVKVSTNLTGRLWVAPSGEDRYFLGCEGWRIERTAPALSPADAYQAKAVAHKAKPITAEEADDLPF